MRFSSTRATLRDMRRAPVRIAASIMAMALAIAAIGVFAVPGVAESSVRSIATQDKLSHIELRTTPIERSSFEAFTPPPGLERLEAHTVGTIETERGNLRVVGRTSASAIDQVRLQAGTLPTEPRQVIATPGLGDVGDVISAANAAPLTIVGVGETTWFSEGESLFMGSATAQELLGINGANRIVARHSDPTGDNLEATVELLRSEIEVAGSVVTSFPNVLVDGAHPIEEDITMVSFMIGSLGVVAGIVALILLASTANAIVTERSRDAAIMRAVGGSRRAVRRDLRRLAISIGAVGTIVGLPLGIVVANVIARMVLTRFAGITPAIGVDLVAMAASAVFGIAGARIVSGRVARRVANTELASALRDRDGVPFGGRWTDRLLTRIPTGGLVHRMALRAIARRRARALSVAAQFAGAVAAAVLVASLATSIIDFNEAELQTFRWESATQAEDPVYPFALDTPTGADAEVGIHAWAEVDGWELEVYGIDPATTMFDTEVVSGSWLGASSATTRTAVLAEKFADQEGHAIGDTITVDLANGPADYEIIGLHPVRSVAVFVPSAALSADLNTDGYGDTVWTTGSATAPSTNGVATRTSTLTDLYAEGAAARDAILAIFGAIGAIVVTIAALGATSTVAMNLYERRSELATIQATGAERRDVRRLVRFELSGLAIAGWAVGIAAGGIGARAIMGFFESENAVELGFTMAWIAVPITAVAAAVFVQLVAMSAASQADRTPVAMTLRAAT